MNIAKELIEVMRENIELREKNIELQKEYIKLIKEHIKTMEEMEKASVELEETAQGTLCFAAAAYEKTADTIIIDTETTGLDERVDELLQVSIIDDNGNVLYNSYLRPLHHSSWKDAEHVNGIKPEMVANAPNIYDEMPKINAIIRAAKKIIGYNIDFDEMFLVASGGLSFDEKETVDVMKLFAPIYGEWNAQYDDYKWQKLTKAANYYGYDWDSRPENAHNSLADCFATLYVYKKICKI